MIEQIFQMLDKEKYNVIEHDDEIKIAQISINTLGQKWVDPEYIIKIIFEGEKTCIAYYYRDKKCDAIVASTISGIICGIIVMCYKHFDNKNFEPQFSRELDDFLENGCIENALEMITKKVPANLFSIFTQKEKCICMLKENDEYIIKYYSKKFQKTINYSFTITKPAHAYYVLFNHSYKLMQFNDIYNKMVELDFIENNCEDTYNYYLNIYIQSV